MFNSSTRLKFKPAGMVIRETNFRKKSLTRFCQFILLEISVFPIEFVFCASAQHGAALQFETPNFVKKETSINIKNICFLKVYVFSRNDSICF